MHLATFASILRRAKRLETQLNGKLVKDVETQEYKDRRRRTLATCSLRVSLIRIHSISPGNGHRPNYQFLYAQKFAIHHDPINGWQDAWRHAL